MSQPEPVTNPWRVWARKRRTLLIAGAAALVLVVAGGVVALNMAQANAAAAAATAAEVAEQEAEYNAAAEDAKSAVDSGEERYSESAEYGTPADRVALRNAIDSLTIVIAAPDSTAKDLQDATEAAEQATSTVGTAAAAAAAKAAAEAAAEEAAAEAKQAALDEKYEKRAAELEDNGMYGFEEGQEYCNYLDEWYAPEDVYDSLWSDETEAGQIDVAAVEVYCPEYEKVMKVVLSGFNDGEYVVGSDFPAGTYRTYGGVSDCYWERNDGSGNILDNNFVSSAHNGLTVTVNEGEGFVTERCGLWIPK